MTGTRHYSGELFLASEDAHADNGVDVKTETAAVAEGRGCWLTCGLRQERRPAYSLTKYSTAAIDTTTMPPVTYTSMARVSPVSEINSWFS